MTEMYDKPRKFEGKLKAHPHEEKGVEVSCVLLAVGLSASGRPSV